MSNAGTASRRVALGFGLAMGATAAVTALRDPRAAARASAAPALNLDLLFPRQAGPWALDRHSDVFIRPENSRNKVYGVYDQVLERLYRRPDGAQVMLCVAYGGRQSDGLHVHRPENCYRGAGFEVSGLSRIAMLLADRTVPASRLLATRPDRCEPITYWTLFGDRVENDPREANWMKLRAGLHGQVLDGMLIRVSTIDTDAARGHRVQAQFADALVRAIDPGYRTRVIGA
jgi:EpsI family protein